MKSITRPLCSITRNRVNGKKRFSVQRIIGSRNLWITEFVLSYEGVPSYTVSIMEFREGLVANET